MVERVRRGSAPSPGPTRARWVAGAGGKVAGAAPGARGTLIAAVAVKRRLCGWSAAPGARGAGWAENSAAWPAALLPHARRPCGRKLPGATHARAMATAAAETEASSTDAGWESGGGGSGDDGMKPALPELESSLQNGGGGGCGARPEETAAAEAARSHGHEQPQHTSEAAGAALPKGAEEPERPFRRSFQIPRKSREKKGGASPSSQPLSLFPPPPSFSLEPLCLLFPHPSETRKHARKRQPPLPSLPRPPSRPWCERRIGWKPRSSVLPLPVQVGSKLRFEAFP